MNEELRFFIAFNDGLTVMQKRKGSMATLGEFFSGRTVECLTGSQKRPGVVFAGVAFDGGYRTQDGGRTWEKVMNGDVRAFAIDPNDERVIYLGTGPVRLYRSEDGGTSWEPLDSLLDLPEKVRSQWTVPKVFEGKEVPHVRNVFIHPDDSNLIFAVLEHGGLTCSRDRGKTWEDASSGIAYLDMHVLGNYPKSKQRYYVSSARGFFRSDNGGREWRRIENGMPWAYTEMHSYSHDWLFLPGTPLRMIVAGASGSPGVWWDEKRDPRGVVLLSDDDGENWRQPSAGLPARMPWMPWVLVPDPKDPKTVFAGMGDGSRGFGFNPKEKGHGALYVTRDRGESWEPILVESPSILTVSVAAN